MKNAPPSLRVLGYEIPAPSLSVFASHAVITVLPTVAFAVAGHFIAAMHWAAGAAAFFHLRNVIVRREIARGWHGQLARPSTGITGQPQISMCDDE